MGVSPGIGVGRPGIEMSILGLSDEVCPRLGITDGGLYKTHIVGDLLQIYILHSEEVPVCMRNLELHSRFQTRLSAGFFERDPLLWNTDSDARKERGAAGCYGTKELTLRESPDLNLNGF